MSLLNLQKVVVMFKDHDTISFDDMKDKKLILKEGCEYKIKYIFTLNDSIKALSLITSYFKGGFCVSKETDSYGDFNSSASSPSTFEITIPKEDDKWKKAPSGFIARGSYGSKIQFITDDQKVNLDIPYSVEIKKEWS